MRGQRVTTPISQGAAGIHQAPSLCLELLNRLDWSLVLLAAVVVLSRLPTLFMRAMEGIRTPGALRARLNTLRQPGSTWFRGGRSTLLGAGSGTVQPRYSASQYSGHPLLCVD